MKQQFQHSIKLWLFDDRTIFISINYYVAVALKVL